MEEELKVCRPAFGRYTRALVLYTAVCAGGANAVAFHAQRAAAAVQELRGVAERLTTVAGAVKAKRAAVPDGAAAYATAAAAPATD